MKSLLEVINESFGTAIRNREYIIENPAESPNIRFDDNNEMVLFIEKWAKENDVNLVVRNLEEITGTDFQYNRICRIDGNHYTPEKDFSQNKLYNELCKPNTVFLIRNYNDYSNEWREYAYSIVKQHLFIGEELKTILFTIATTNPDKELLGVGERSIFRNVDNDF